MQPQAYNKQLWQQGLLDWLILFLCTFSLVVDMLNGYLMLGGVGLPISMAYKAGLLLLVLLRVAITDLRLVTALLAFFILLQLPGWALFLNKGIFSLFFVDISTAMRVLFFISFLVYIAIAQPSIKKAQFIMKLITLSMFINLAIGLAGFGYPTYSAADGFGVKGYIFAGNELAITLVCVCYFFLFSWARNKPWVIKVSAAFLVAVCGVLVATKSAILGTTVLAGSFLFLYTRKTFIVIITLLFVAMLIYATHIYEFIKASGAIDRFIFFYNKGGLLRLILSSREDFFHDMAEFALANFGLLGWVIGWSQGAFIGFVKPAAEIDLIDLYFYFGITGIVTYFLFFYLVFNLLNAQKSFFKSPQITIWCLIFAISIFAGHVVYSGVAAIPVTLALYATASSMRSHGSNT